MKNEFKYGAIFMALLGVWCVVMFGLVGVSIWLFKATGPVENSVLAPMVFCLKILPGVFGVSGMAGGPLWWSAFGWIDGP
jgi:hypothetical protein